MARKNYADVGAGFKRDLKSKRDPLTFKTMCDEDDKTMWNDN